MSPLTVGFDIQRAGEATAERCVDKGSQATSLALPISLSTAEKVGEKGGGAGGTYREGPGSNVSQM